MHSYEDALDVSLAQRTFAPAKASGYVTLSRRRSGCSLANPCAIESRTARSPENLLGAIPTKRKGHGSGRNDIASGSSLPRTDCGLATGEPRVHAGDALHERDRRLVPGALCRREFLGSEVPGGGRGRDA